MEIHMKLVFKVKLASLLMLLCNVALPLSVSAQSWGPRTLPQLKAEAQRRADAALPPVEHVKPADMREALTQINSLEPDEWARAFIKIGDVYMSQAEQAFRTNADQAAQSYKYAWEVYNAARWPTENSPLKKLAYEKALTAFEQYGKLISPAVEVVRFPFEGKQAVAYLRLPQDVRPAPLIFAISGLDTRKEDMVVTNDLFLKNGIGIFAIDQPGTGQSPLKIDVGSERVFSAALDFLQTRSDVDAKRIVVRGQSWAGYWAAIMGYTEKDRILGTVVHGVGIHSYFSPEWQSKGLSTEEYLFDLLPARSAVYDVKTREEFLAYGPRMSLLTQGYLDKPSAPMLVINGLKDTQQPIDDLFLLMSRGDPKDVWMNPAGGHMGRSPKWSAPEITQKVVIPWVLRRLQP
jgi:pimeloyl-ACP methyl ester carboxylesterase